MKFMYEDVSLRHLDGLDPKTVTFIIDIGKVVTNFLDGTTVAQAKVNDAYLDVLPYDDAFRVIGKAVKAFKVVGIVSRCGPVVQDMVETWLQHHRLYERTGFDIRNQYFTRRCAQKASAVQKHFGGATYFVDDGMQVLDPMAEIVDHRMLYGPQSAGFATPQGIVRVGNWLEVERYTGLV